MKGLILLFISQFLHRLIKNKLTPEGVIDVVLVSLLLTLRPGTLFQRDSNTSVFLSILRNF